MVGSLLRVSRTASRVICASSYPGIYHARCLHKDYLLDKLDAAYTDARCGGVHVAQDIRFDGGHELPMVGIAGIGETASKFKYEIVF